ncbi:MAG: PHP-associated domain-containing protein [Halobacteriaceae archaeon]
MPRVDPHVKLLDERVVRRAKRRGLDALVYAPHFTRLPDARERADAASDDDLLVVPGREVFTGTWRNRRHVLAVGLSEPVPDFIPLERAMAEFERQGAVVLVPHPEFATVSLDADDIARYPIDAVEAYNPKHLARHNRRAGELAARFDLPAFGSSYAHRLATVGEVWTTVEAPLSGEADLLAALRGGAFRVGRRDGLRHDLRRAAEMAHLGWENSWEKLDRVLLSGMEPTHPRQVAYGGRFDDDALY